MPGDTKTGFTDARAKSIKGDDIYKGCIASSVAVMEHDEKNGMPPEEIAESIYRIAIKNHVKPLYTIGVMYKLLIILQKVLQLGLLTALLQAYM
jgi:hypothetical protein